MATLRADERKDVYRVLLSVKGNRMPPSGVRGFSPAALDAAILRKRVSSDDLADSIGVSRQSVNAWRRARTIPAPFLIAKMARWLDVSIADLVPIPDDKLRLSDLRVRAGMSQRQAADKLAIGTSTLTEIEKGRRPVSTDIASRMQSVYAADQATVLDSWERTNAARRSYLDSL
ncbi:hypothetical protein CH263_10360 [Rhodococcus sp. 06-1059B-a]|nr:helix-turn-helix transcriptional regulator [Rhodococcus sp. 06-1059B-a]OZD68119.1 hypothetical protein CH263_10360 [Rhodococcus sp. 06-1059B-a]